MSDLREPEAARGGGERGSCRKSDLRIAFSALIAAVGIAALAGSGQAATAVPHGSAAASGRAVAAPMPSCPAGWRWEPRRYNRWSVWHPGHCELERG